MYPAKTYKVRPLYNFLYQAIYDVLSDKKSLLTKALLTRLLGSVRTKELAKYSFNDLIKKMIMNLNDELVNTSYERLKLEIHNHSRISKLLDEFSYFHDSNTVLTHITFRLNDETINKIAELKVKTLGDVIELAIVNFLASCDQDIYDLILQSIHCINDEKSPTHSP